MRLSAIRLAAGFVLLGATPAWAYIDPGSSSVAYQLLIAGVLALGFRFRQVFRRIADLVTRRRRTRDDIDTFSRK